MRFLLTLLTSCLMFTMNVNAQQTYRVVKGPRPPIDLQSLSETAYTKGVLSIKISDKYAQMLDENPVQIDVRGNIVFGIPVIDQLNQSWGVDDFKKTFESEAFKTRFTERHRAWGFHRWYKLYFDDANDVKQMIQEYMASGAIEVAEPEYSKQLVVNQQPAGAPEDFSFKGPAWTPNDPRYDEQWHYHNTGQQNGTPDADIDLPEAWEINRGSADVLVAIIDQGVQSSHPDLQAHMWPEIGFNFVNNTPNIAPGDHGSHVAGTVSAINNNGLGVAGVAGGNGPDDGVRLMSCQVFNPTFGGGGFELAPVYAADNGAAISQNSWGYTSKGYYEQAVLDAIDYFNVNGGGGALLGGITIFAAGNDNQSGQWYPGCYEGCFSVAATNNQDKHAWYSNYDTWVDVAAPGGDTEDVAARGVLSCWKNSNYGFYQGTSMACPHVSGVAALIVSLAYGQFTPDQVAEIIRTTTDNIDALNPGYIGKMGSGRINAQAALMATLELMINVDNPFVFTAIAPTHDMINLNWIKNDDNNDVMVAYSATGDFGDLEQGTPYEVNDVIPGGGVILYKGDAINYAHSGLNSNTLYRYKAWSVNEADEYSMGLETSATTRKTPITEFPHLEPFALDEFPPLNWENKTVSGNGQWDVQSEGSQPECLPYSGDAMARFASHDFTAGASGMLISPPVDFAADGYEIGFMLYRDDAAPDVADRIEVYVHTAPTTSFATLLGTINRSINLQPVVTEAGWYPYSIELPVNQHNKQLYVILKGIGAGGNNLFVDDFTIEIPTTCFPPEQITITEVMASTALVSWQAVEPALTWDVELGEKDFEPGTGTLFESIPDTLLQLDELMPGTEYEVYLRSTCAPEDNSSWIGPYSFTTLCQSNIPWEEYFETMDSTFVCFQSKVNTEEDGGLNGTNLTFAQQEGAWFICTAEDFGGQGNEFIYEGQQSAAISGGGQNFNWLMTGELILTEDTPVDLVFMLKYLVNEGNQGYFYVNVWNDGIWRPAFSIDEMEVAANDFDFPVRVNLDAYQGQTIRLAFVYKSNQSQPLAIDNIKLAPALNYWTGSVSNSWVTSDNWRLQVPESHDAAVILPGRYQPEINDALNQDIIWLNEGATLKILSGGKLTVNQEFVNETGLNGVVMEQGASLIHPETALPASTTYQPQTEWMLLSAPVSGQVFDTAATAAAQIWKKWDAGNWVYARNEDGWNPDFEKEFVAGRGYYFESPENVELPFAGNSMGSSVAVPVTASGWYLTGNPFTSALLWEPTDSRIAAIAKVADPVSGALIDLYPGGIIPPFAGFMAEVVQDEAFDFILDAANRMHAEAFVPGPASGSIVVKVSESSTGSSQQAVIRFDQAATSDYDAMYDSHFVPMNAPSLYTMAGDDMLSTNTLPGISSGQVIPLGFVKNAADEFKLNISFDDAYNNMVVALYDKVTGEVHDLVSPAEVDFSAADGDDHQRFELIFGTLGTDENLLESIKVFIYDNTLHILGAPAGSMATIFDSSGRLVKSLSAISSSVERINAGSMAPGWYVVSVRTAKTVKSFKVIKY